MIEIEIENSEMWMETKTPKSYKRERINNISKHYEVIEEDVNRKKSLDL